MGIKDAEKLNCSTIFLLPAIGLQRKDILQYGFVSAFVTDKDHEPQYDNSVYLLFKPSDMDSFQDFLNYEYKKTKNLVDDYDYPGGFVVMVYRFPEELIKDYKLFLKGKYSRFSEKFKSLFPTTAEVLSPDGIMERTYSLAYLVFNRLDSVKKYWEETLGVVLGQDSEMWSRPDPNGLDNLQIEQYRH